MPHGPHNTSPIYGIILILEETFTCGREGRNIIYYVWEGEKIFKVWFTLPYEGFTSLKNIVGWVLIKNDLIYKFGLVMEEIIFTSHMK